MLDLGRGAAEIGKAQFGVDHCSGRLVEGEAQTSRQSEIGKRNGICDDRRSGCIEESRPRYRRSKDMNALFSVEPEQQEVSPKVPDGPDPTAPNDPFDLLLFEILASAETVTPTLSRDRSNQGNQREDGRKPHDQSPCCAGLPISSGRGAAFRFSARDGACRSAR